MNRTEILKTLGGPIAPDLMEGTPSYEEWLRYFLYRFDVAEAYRLAAWADFYKLRRPREFLDVKPTS